MDIDNNPDVLICGSFVRFKYVDNLISCSDSFIAFEREVYMKEYGLSYDDAQTCAQMEYDLKLDIMSNSYKVRAIIDKQATQMNTVYDHHGMEFKSISYMCKYWGVQPYTYMTRRRNGWNVKDALLGRKSITFAKMKEEKRCRS